MIPPFASASVHNEHRGIVDSRFRHSMTQHPRYFEGISRPTRRFKTYKHFSDCRDPCYFVDDIREQRWLIGATKPPKHPRSLFTTSFPELTNYSHPPSPSISPPTHTYRLRGDAIACKFLQSLCLNCGDVHDTMRLGLDSAFHSHLFVACWSDYWKTMTEPTPPSLLNHPGPCPRPWTNFGPFFLRD